MNVRATLVHISFNLLGSQASQLQVEHLIHGGGKGVGREWGSVEGRVLQHLLGSLRPVSFLGPLRVSSVVEGLSILDMVTSQNTNTFAEEASGYRVRVDGIHKELVVGGVVRGSEEREDFFQLSLAQVGAAQQRQELDVTLHVRSEEGVKSGLELIGESLSSGITGLLDTFVVLVEDSEEIVLKLSESVLSVLLGSEIVYTFLEEGFGLFVVVSFLHGFMRNNSLRKERVGSLEEVTKRSQ